MGEDSTRRTNINGLTEYITQCRWEDIFTIWFVEIDDLYRGLYAHGRIRQRGPRPRFTDTEVITVGMICDTFFGGNEELTLSFIRQYTCRCFLGCWSPADSIDVVEPCVWPPKSFAVV